MDTDRACIELFPALIFVLVSLSLPRVLVLACVRSPLNVALSSYLGWLGPEVRDRRRRWRWGRGDGQLESDCRESEVKLGAASPRERDVWESVQHWCRESRGASPPPQPNLHRTPSPEDWRPDSARRSSLPPRPPHRSDTPRVLGPAALILCVKMEKKESPSAVKMTRISISRERKINDRQETKRK
ncbi:hypothetical protein E2C01_035338 [Portunus trituberculatus]|uniref:Uncharacterized protein n=1 Tax=Portunus trituberculatus TaxID=210409 RepID=A0A5B7F8X6_PORTR|nr:hypothetical protein [Portunus trituberculatus]